jgi:hypothetical protein
MHLGVRLLTLGMKSGNERLVEGHTYNVEIILTNKKPHTK